MPDRERTAEQRGAVDRYSDAIAQAVASARKELGVAGLDEDAHFECLICDCDGFTSAPGRPRCRTPGCDHSFFQHNLPI